MEYAGRTTEAVDSDSTYSSILVVVNCRGPIGSSRLFSRLTCLRRCLNLWVRVGGRLRYLDLHNLTMVGYAAFWREFRRVPTIALAAQRFRILAALQFCQACNRALDVYPADGVR